MCLCTVYEGRKKENAINRLDVRVDGYIWLWKAFGEGYDGNLHPPCFWANIYEGKNTAKGNYISYYDYSGFGGGHKQYKAGFHCMTTERNAKPWGQVIVPIKVKREWITSIGLQDGDKCVVCKHIII